MNDLLSVAQAIAILDAVEVRPRVIRLALEAAQGTRLAEPLRAHRDYPPFDKSLMDGYAVRSADLVAARALKVVGEIAAGQMAQRPLGPGEAMAIMTGAPLPQGADGVLPVEDAQERDGILSISVSPRGKAERYVSKQASEMHAGDMVLSAAVRLEAAQLAVAATVGAATLPVYARPRVALLCTGNELVAVDAAAQGPRIRNSNQIMLSALLRRLHADVLDLGTCADDPAAIADGVRRAADADCLVVTGGMSMGRYDFVPRVLTDLGFRMAITKLRIKPGKPFVFALGQGPAFVFGLPGNPVSAFVCTLRLVRRVLDRLGGGEPRERWRTLRLQTPLAANGDREFYQPAAYLPDEGVRPLTWKGSADVFTLARAQALLVREENEPALPAGASVRVMDITGN